MVYFDFNNAGYMSRACRLPSRLRALLDTILQSNSNLNQQCCPQNLLGTPLRSRLPDNVWKYSSPLLRFVSTEASPAHFPSYTELKTAASAAGTAAGTATLSPGPPPPRVRYLFRSFRRSATLKRRALGFNINNDLYQATAGEFYQLVQALSPSALATLEALDTNTAHSIIFSRFVDYVQDLHQDKIDAHADVVRTLDLRLPHLWYQAARDIPRKVIYHAGPTNSGKTYNALAAMRAAPSGIYCGPLRLLAMEVYEACNTQGTLCSLVTGQERREVPGAAHIACTVEMTSMSQRVDVAVIDEIQLIGDASRGWAWTRALLGVPADEVHVCGDGSAIDLVKWMCSQAGEEIEVRTYDRFTPLDVENPGHLRDGLAGVVPGDCVVAFSRAQIFSIKAAIEASTPHRAAVVYGALPTNAPVDDVQIHVVNRRICLMTLAASIECASSTPVPVTASMVKQIAGRAGRRGSEFGKGLVACLAPGDASKLREGLETAIEALPQPRAGLYPEFEHIEAFAGRRPGDPFPALLAAFADLALLQGRFQLCRQDTVLEIAHLLEGVEGLSLNEMYTMCMAPATTKEPRIAAALLHFARRYAAGDPCTLDIRPGDEVPVSAIQLKQLETAYQIVSLWLWLSYRFEEGAFPGREVAVATGERICLLMASGLEKVTAQSKAQVKHGKGKPPRAERRSSRESRKLTTREDLKLGSMFEAFAAEVKEVNAFLKARREEGGEEAWFDGRWQRHRRDKKS